MRIFVIIVTYNAMPWIDRCIQSVYQSHQHDMTVGTILIDNGSQDGTLEYVRQHYPDVICMPNTDNLGFGAANNIGMKYAIDNNADYVYLLNQDAWVSPDVFKLLASNFALDPSWGILSPLQMTPDSNVINKSFTKFKRRNKKWMTLLLEGLYRGDNHKAYQLRFAPAAHWMISAECIKKVGGFSPTFYHYTEDDNYINRVNYHGFKVGFVPSAIGYHCQGSHKGERLFAYFGHRQQYLKQASDPNRSIFEQWLNITLYYAATLVLLSMAFCYKMKGKPVKTFYTHTARLSTILSEKSICRKAGSRIFIKNTESHGKG